MFRLWQCKSRVVSEDSFVCGQKKWALRRGLEVGVGGWPRAVRVGRYTKAIGVDDSVRVCGMGDRLGRVKGNPLVHDSGNVPGRKRLDAQHGGAALRTTEASWEMGKVGSGGFGLGMIQQQSLT